MKKTALPVLTFVLSVVMVATGLAWDQKLEMKSAPAVRSKDAVDGKNVLLRMATISGKITIDSKFEGGPMGLGKCTDVNVSVHRNAAGWVELNQRKKVLLTTKAMGGVLKSGCTYSAKVIKGDNTEVTAQYIIIDRYGGKESISGSTPLFNFVSDITKDIKMDHYTFTPTLAY